MFIKIKCGIYNISNNRTKYSYLYYAIIINKTLQYFFYIFFSNKLKLEVLYKKMHKFDTVISDQSTYIILVKFYRVLYKMKM